jgi:predicted dehydrogenase
MDRIKVGVIGASPLRPGWAVAAHLPALAALPDYQLAAVATSSAESARAAGERFGVPAYADPAALIAAPEVELVVVTVKVPHHQALVAAALDAGKMVMCEWPLGLDAGETAALAARADKTRRATLIGLQARMAPAIRYARDLVAQGYVGEVLGTTLVGSGIGWGPTATQGQAYLYDAANGATTLSVPMMHALDAMSFVLGKVAEVRATAAVRRRSVRLTDLGRDLAVTAPDHVAIAATLANGAIASMFYRGGVSRGDNLRWEINGSEGDLVLTSPVGNLQVLDPTLQGGRDEAATVEVLPIPTAYDLAPTAPAGPAANVARLYAAFARDLRTGRPDRLAPDFALARRRHDWLNAIEAAVATGMAQSIERWPEDAGSPTIP